MSARCLRFVCIGAFFLAGPTHIATAQRQLQKLLPSNPESHSSYAFTCAISGDWAITAAAGSSQIYGGAGAAYVSQRVNGTWVESQALLDPNAVSSAQFGRSVAMDGDWAVIGAPGARQAFVYERVGTTWIERQRLTHPVVPAWGDEFGKQVDISGDRIAVHDDSGNTGEVFVFERAGTTWNHVAALRPSEVTYGAGFGATLDLDGDRLVAGSPGWPFWPFVYVFVRTPQGVWTLEQRIPTPDYVPGSLNNGVVVALSGNTLFLSTNATVGPAVMAGRAHIFQRVEGVWTEFQTITANDVEANDGFVIRLVKGDLAIGRSQNEDDAGNNSGSCYVFRRSPNWLWSQTGKVLPNQQLQIHPIGWTVGLHDNVLMVGHPGDADACAGLSTNPFCHTGAVYFFDLPPTATQYGSCPSATPCSSPDAHGGCRNSTGQGAIMQASGSGSVLSDDLIIELRKLPPNAPALFFMGDVETFANLGAGQLRVGGGALGLHRLGVEFADAQGVIVRSPGLVAATQSLGLGAITAGQTWNFQAWYRDTPSTCAPSNLSNALRVSFTP